MDFGAAIFFTDYSIGPAALGRCVLAARRLAETTGYAGKGFRLSVNTGPEGGQVVYHVHFHFTAGRRPRTDA